MLTLFKSAMDIRRRYSLALCALLTIVLRSDGRCASSKLTLLAFVPCYDLAGAALRAKDGDQCDVLTYAAAQLAADHINRDSSILGNTTLELMPFVSDLEVCIRFRSEKDIIVIVSVYSNYYTK